MKKLLLFLFATLVAATFVHAEATVGKPAPNFKLRDVNDKDVSLSDFKGKIVVLEWVNYDCPFVKKFYDGGEMQKLQADFTARGVVWLSICSSAPGKQGHFSGTEIKTRMAKEKATPTAYLFDSKGDVGKLYGAKTTPHMFVVDYLGELAYAGGIDSIRSVAPSDIAKAEPYLKNAVEALLAGNPVEKATTEAYGCSVKY